MSLRYLRKLLSIVLVVVMALGSTMLIGFQLVCSTVCSESYVARFIDSKHTDKARREAFGKKIEALEAKSGIPARVFDAVYNYSEVTEDTAIHRVFKNFDAGLYNEAMVDRFEGLCKEYLDGTNTKYDEKLVKNTAIEAAKIYSDTFGLKGVQEYKSFVDAILGERQTIMSFAAILIMLPVTLIFLMFQKATAILIHILPSFTATGLTLFLSGITGLIFRIGQLPKITPVVYATALGNAVKGTFFLAILLGAVIFTLSLIEHIYLVDKAKNE